ncbi:MAG: hypothetical protein M9930_07285 [Anaerolineae bacterium]|nr:hypothetical protein [Anaerolineae bacterium]
MIKQANAQVNRPSVLIDGQPDGSFVTRRSNRDGSLTAQPCGGQAYPFPARTGGRWQIVSHPIDADLSAVTPPTLRLVREDKVVDLVVERDAADFLAVREDGDGRIYFEVVSDPILSTAGFLDQTGLELSMARGAFVLSKRLSRLFSPYRMWSFYQTDEVTISECAALDGKLWDGIGLVTRAFVARALPHMALNVPDRFRPKIQHTLATCRRFEVTVLTAAGQYKGDVIVVDHLPDWADPTADFVFPAGAAKTEVRYHKGIFVGFNQARKAKQTMRLDIQSVINLYPFFSHDQLVRWLEADSAAFLANIRNGHTDRIMQGLIAGDSAESLRSWWLGEYFLSGGKALWFAGVVRALGRQRDKVLRLKVAGKQRLPIPGGRYYIAPAAAGLRTVPRGCVQLDAGTASAFVNDTDWLDFIVPVLGGCDGDDAVWVLPFREQVDGIDAVTGEVTMQTIKRILLWRSPNQAGEYVILKPMAGTSTPLSTGASASLSTGTSTLLSTSVSTVLSTSASASLSTGTSTSLSTRSAEAVGGADALAEATDARHTWLWPLLDSGKLPPRSDSPAATEGVTIGRIAADEMTAQSCYAVDALDDAIARAQANVGVLGRYVNVLMVCMATFGRLPRVLPAPLEDVIDGVVKDGRDLTAVNRWCEQAATQLARQRQPVSSVLAGRISGMTPLPLTTTNDHWLDELTAAIHAHREALQADLDALALQTCPPVDLFVRGSRHVSVGRDLTRRYTNLIGRTVRTGTLSRHTYRQAAQITRKALAQHGDAALLGAAVAIYAGGLAGASADDVLFQVGAPDDGGIGEADIAMRFVHALQQAGIIGQPVLNERGNYVWFDDTPTPQAVAVTIVGTWFNWLRATKSAAYEQMGAVPQQLSQQAKQRLSAQIWRFQGVELTVERRNNRLLTHTPQGNLFGYIAKGQEDAVAAAAVLRVVYATVTTDGNVQAVVVRV